MPNLTDPFFVILVFYMYALARWQIVKRAPFFFLGVLGVLFAFVGLFFTLGNSTVKVFQIFHIIGLLVAFASAVLACAGSLAAVPGMTKAPPAE